jgi:hypothetical protein
MEKENLLFRDAREFRFFPVLPQQRWRLTVARLISIWLGSTHLDSSQTCRNDHPTVDDLVKSDGIALAYIPLQPDEEFKNPLEIFSTWKFDYKEEETRKLERLARGEQNRSS